MTRCLYSNKTISNQLLTTNDDITTIASLSNTCPLFLIIETIPTIDHAVQSVDDSCNKQQSDLYYGLLTIYFEELKEWSLYWKRLWTTTNYSWISSELEKKYSKIKFAIWGIGLFKLLDKRLFISITSLLPLLSIIKLLMTI